jgi:hypothetical protein
MVRAKERGSSASDNSDSGMYRGSVLELREDNKRRKLDIEERRLVLAEKQLEMEMARQDQMRHLVEEQAKLTRILTENLLNKQ